MLRRLINISRNLNKFGPLNAKPVTLPSAAFSQKIGESVKNGNGAFFNAKSGLFLSACIGALAFLKIYHEKDFIGNLKLEGIIHEDNLEDQDTKSLNESIDEIKVKKQELDEILSEINIKFEKLDKTLFVQTAIDELDESFLLSIDDEWLELSKIVQSYTKKLVAYRGKYNEIENKLKDTLLRIDSAKLIDFKGCKIQDFLEMGEKPHIFIQLSNIYNEIKSSELPKGFKDEECDPTTLLYYLYKKYQILQSLRVEKLKDIIKSLKSESDLELKRLSRLYKEKVEELEKKIMEPINNEVQRNIMEFVQDYSAAHHKQLIYALEHQRQDIESAYRTKLEIAQSEIFSTLEEEYDPIIASTEALQEIIDYNDTILEKFKQHSRALRTAYAIKLVLGNSDQISLPLGSFLNRIESDIEDDSVKLVISRFPKSSTIDGVYNINILIDELPALVTHAKKLAFTRDRNLSPWLKYVSSIHSALRMKNHDKYSQFDDEIQQIFDTYEVLDSVEQEIKQRDIVECIKKLKSLTGNSRRVFDKWLVKSSDAVETQALSDLLLVLINNRTSYN